MHLSLCLADCSQVRLLRLEWKFLCVLGRAAQLIPSAGHNEGMNDSPWAPWGTLKHLDAHLGVSEGFYSPSSGAGMLELQKQWGEEHDALQTSPGGLWRRMEGAQAGP